MHEMRTDAQAKQSKQWQASVLPTVVLPMWSIRSPPGGGERIDHIHKVLNMPRIS